MTTKPICLYKEFSSDLVKELTSAADFDCNVLITPITNPNFHREFERDPMSTSHIAFSRSDLLLDPLKWKNSIVVKLSESIDCDSIDANVRQQSELMLKQEIAFAQHLASGCILVKIHGTDNVNLARTITSSLKGSLLFVEVPMVDSITQSEDSDTDIFNTNNSNNRTESTWHWWNNFRAYSDYDNRFQVALEMSNDVLSDEEILRWLGEPIELLIVPTHIFVNNKKNYPVLTIAHKAMALKFLKKTRCQFAIKRTTSGDQHFRSCVEYLKFLYKEIGKVPDIMQGYDDLLETPLQPLYDNLDSYTYEIFEKDPVKYIYYQRAIERALVNKVSEAEIAIKKIIIMVVGAGRGPLVRAAINASTNTNRKIKVYVIEKNPNAIVTLKSLKDELWTDKDITIISTDMRDFEPPEQADILVSELLGSFGDNELSPECLDGAQKHLKSDGISIPCRSTSYLNPVMSPKLLSVIRDVRGHMHRTKPFTYDMQSESNYVVYLKNAYHIARARPAFVFVHPNRKAVIDNTRYIRLKFDVEQDCVMTGLAGYFDTVLYDDIVLSIHPETHTKGLISWFSMYFPLAEPQQLKAGDVIEINFWRCESNKQVWYEWNTTSPKISHIHNFKGLAFPIYK